MASNDDLLFAEHAVKAGFVTEDQVRESLQVQDRMAEMGVSESLRNVLVKRGVIREGDAAVVARSAGLRSGREPIPGYTLEARVGTGAMGTVYRAYQRGMKRHVAIKILRRDLTDDPRQVERLRREAMLVGKLDHPSIVRGLDSGQSDGLVWFVMEYVEGRTLQARIREDGPLFCDDAVVIARKMAEAIAHAHEHGVVHRDIKPGNILLTKDDEPRLTDYGLAKGETDDALTHLDATLGTPQYIAPEQARNPRDADLRSDVYSLGATLYAMLAGRPPFQAESLAATLTKVLYERPMPLAEAAPETPPEVVYVVERMMAKDRRHRYATPEELVRDLRALEAGRLNVPAGFRGDIESFVERRRRRRLWSAVAAVAVLLLAAVVAAQVYVDRAARLKRERAARADFATIVDAPDLAGARDGALVERMIRSLDQHVGRFADGPTVEQARVELARWRRQADAIERVQELNLRRHGSADGPTDWPRLVADVRAELVRLSRDPDADVARGRLEDVLSDVEAERDRRARDAGRLARTDVSDLSLLEAAARCETLATELRDRFYGIGDAPESDAALALARRFRRARSLLDGHFQSAESAVRDAHPVDTDLGALERRLFAAREAATSDDELMRLLAELPPAGTRRGMVAARHDALRERIERLSSRRWTEIRARSERLVADRRYGAAEELLLDESDRLLAAERAVALAERERVAERRSVEQRELVAVTRDYAASYLGAIGRRDYRDAADQLSELASFTAQWSDEGSVADRLVREGRRLLELIDKRAWGPLRQRLTSGAPLVRGLGVGRGIRYERIQDVRLAGDELRFTYGDGLSWQGRLRDVDLDDLLHYAGLPGADAEGALVAATLRILETSGDEEPGVVLERMTTAAPWLETAHRSGELGAVVTLLADRRRELEEGGRAELAETEDRARQLHEDARRDLETGRYADAFRRLDTLLRVRRLWRTDYVRRRRDEIERERERASDGRVAVRYAERLPGTRLVEHGDGTASMTVDFESPDVARAVATTPGRGEIVRKGRLPAALPGGGDEVGLVENHAFEWAAWDGLPETHPRLFPVRLASPFEVRRRVEVSFLYRSDAPFFLLVSIGGTSVGVLSADDVREAGRGVVIWQDETLESPDVHFTERHRSGYLERHPGVIEKEGAGAFFSFSPGRLYRVRFVKDERRASLWVDGRKLVEEDLRSTTPKGPLRDQVVVQSYTSGEVDDIVVTGILDPDWLKKAR